jgi:hypothetical protein
LLNLIELRRNKPEVLCTQRAETKTGHGFNLLSSVLRILVLNMSDAPKVKFLENCGWLRVFKTNLVIVPFQRPSAGEISFKSKSDLSCKDKEFIEGLCGAVLFLE